MSINVTEALNKETYAYKCWYNYNYGKNTLGISDSDYASIIGKWKDSIGAWSDFAKDENKYEISDSELSDYKTKGKQSAKDATGYAGGGKGKMIGRAVGDTAMVAGSVVAPKVAGKVGEKLASKAAEKAAASTMDAGGTAAAEKAVSNAHEASGNVKNNAAKAGILVACAMSLATGILSRVKKANQEQKEACDTLKNEVLPEAQGALADTQDYMEETEEELLELSEEAEEKNEEANDEIEEKKTDFDAERRIYDNLMSKKTAGEELRDDEKQWLKDNAPKMTQISEEIDEISEGTSDEVNDLYDQMGEKEENYDEAAESIAEVDGIEDYAESFDSATKTMCYVEGGIQTLNTLCAGLNAKKAIGMASGLSVFGAGAIYWAAAAAAVVGGGLSTVSAAEQFKWAGEVGQEIDLRKDTQAMSDETTEAYDEKVEVYEGTMGIMEDMELEIPDDLEVPEGVTTEGEGSEEAQPDTGLLQEPAKDDDGKKKKEEQ